MERFPELVQFKIASFLCLDPKEIPGIIKLYTDPTYFNADLQGLYWFGKVKHGLDSRSSGKHFMIPLYGNIRYLKAMHDLGMKIPDYFSHYAAEYGDIILLKWLHEIGSLGRCVLDTAARKGILDNMKWLHGVGCRLDGGTFRSAVETGILDNMKWLHEVGCPFTCTGNAIVHIFEKAAKNGNLDTMKWLHEAGCPFDDSTYKGAASFGSIENLEWLWSKGLRFGTEDNALNHYGEDLVIMNWLFDRGCRWAYGAFTRRLAVAIKSGNTAALDWAVAHECPVADGINTGEVSAYWGDNPIVDKWLVDNNLAFTRYFLL